MHAYTTFNPKFLGLTLDLNLAINKQPIVQCTSKVEAIPQPREKAERRDRANMAASMQEVIHTHIPVNRSSHHVDIGEVWRILGVQLTSVSE